jgi:hypothetical protein
MKNKPRPDGRMGDIYDPLTLTEGRHSRGGRQNRCQMRATDGIVSSLWAQGNKMQQPSPGMNVATGSFALRPLTPRIARVPLRG